MLRSGGRPLVTNWRLMQKEMMYLCAEIATKSSQTDLGLLPSTSPLVISQPHGDPLEHGVQGDGQDDEEATQGGLARLGRAGHLELAAIEACGHHAVGVASAGLGLGLAGLALGLAGGAAPRHLVGVRGALGDSLRAILHQHAWGRRSDGALLCQGPFV